MRLLRKWERNCAVVSTLSLLLAFPVAALADEPAAGPGKAVNTYIVFKMSEPTARIELSDATHFMPLTVHGDQDGLMIQKIVGGRKYRVSGVQTRFSQHSIFGSRFRIGTMMILEPKPGTVTYFGDALVFPRGGNGPPVTFTIHADDMDEVTTVIHAHHPEIVEPIVMSCVSDGKRDDPCGDPTPGH